MTIKTLSLPPRGQTYEMGANGFDRDSLSFV